MPITIATVASRVVAQLNLNSSYTNVSTDPRAYTQQIADAVSAANGAVIEALLSNPSNGKRRDFLTTPTVNHAALVPTHIGPIGAVTISGVVAIPWPADDVIRERAKTVSTPAEHYALVDERLFLNQGASAAVDIYNFDPASSLAPSELEDPVFAGAMRNLASIEGENNDMAAVYGRFYEAAIQALRAGVRVPEMAV